MNEKEMVMIPFVAHESEMNRMERANKRLFILALVLILGILIYLLLPSEVDHNEQSANNTDGGNISQNIGE